MDRTIRDDYFSWPAVSASDLSYMKQSPAHYIWYKAHHKKTKALDFGTFAHMAFLEPDKFELIPDDSSRPFPDKNYQNSANKQWRELQETFIQVEDKEKILEMKRIAFSDYRIRNAFSKGIAEKGFITDNFNPLNETADGAGYGLACKVKPDWLRDDMVIDLKFCRDATEQGFARECAEYDYAMRAAFYLDVLESIDGKRRDYVFIAFEKEPPYAYNIFVASAQMIAVGLSEYDLMLKAIKHCVDRNDFNHRYEFYTPHPIDISLPSYAIKDITPNYLKQN